MHTQGVPRRKSFIRHSLAREDELEQRECDSIRARAECRHRGKSPNGCAWSHEPTKTCYLSTTCCSPGFSSWVDDNFCRRCVSVLTLVRPTKRTNLMTAILIAFRKSAKIYESQRFFRNASREVSNVWSWKWDIGSVELLTLCFLILRIHFS